MGLQTLIRLIQSHFWSFQCHIILFITKFLCSAFIPSCVPSLLHPSAAPLWLGQRDYKPFYLLLIFWYIDIFSKFYEMFFLFLCLRESVFTSSANTSNFNGIKIHSSFFFTRYVQTQLWENNRNTQKPNTVASTVTQFSTFYLGSSEIRP